MRRYLVVTIAALSAAWISPMLARSVDPAAALPIGVCNQGLGKCMIECEPPGGIEEAEDFTDLGRCQQQCRVQFDGCRAETVIDPDTVVVDPGGGNQPPPPVRTPKVAPGDVLQATPD